MLGVLSGVFIFIIALGYHQILTDNQKPWTKNDIVLAQLVVQQTKTIYGTCIDKEVLSHNVFLEVQFKPTIKPTYILSFQRNPLVSCEELLNTFHFDLKSDDLTKKKEIYQSKEMQQLFGKFQLVKLQKQKYKVLSKKDQFFAVFITQNKIKEQQQLSYPQKTRTVHFGVQNGQFSNDFLKSVFWFSWFNLIGISLVAFYRKNIFNKTSKITISIFILLYLIIDSYMSSSIQNLNEQIKLIAVCYIAIICLKNNVNKWLTLVIICIFYINKIQTLATTQLQIFQINESWPLSQSDVGIFNIATNIALIILGTVCILKFGQCVEVKRFSLVSFFTLAVLENRIFKVQSLLSELITLITVMFGLTLLEVFQLRQDLIEYQLKTKIKLQNLQFGEQQNLVQVSQKQENHQELLF